MQSNENLGAKLAAWCLANDYQLTAVLVVTGLSGGRADNLPGLQSAIDQACKTKSALVVYSLSRLARSTKDTIAIGEKNYLTKKGNVKWPHTTLKSILQRVA